MPHTILRAKCAIVGDSKVGKTALTQMFYTDGRNFPKNYNMTFGVDLAVKPIKIPDKDDTVEIYLYDSSGRDVYTEFLPRYWHEPDIVMCVFDVTSERSLDSVKKWLTVTQKDRRDTLASLPGVLFGNKTDLVERRVISPKSGVATAEKYGLNYFEGSAKDNVGIEEPFFLLAHEFHKLKDGS